MVPTSSKLLLSDIAKKYGELEQECTHSQDSDISLFVRAEGYIVHHELLGTQSLRGKAGRICREKGFLWSLLLSCWNHFLESWRKPWDDNGFNANQDRET